MGRRARPTTRTLKEVIVKYFPRLSDGIEPDASADCRDPNPDANEPTTNSVDNAHTEGHGPDANGSGANVVDNASTELRDPDPDANDRSTNSVNDAHTEGR